MTNRNEIKGTIIKLIEAANNHQLAEAYVELVGCGECPYRHDCRNENVCYDYIFNKLETDAIIAEENARGCYNCNYEIKGLFDEPCVYCEPGKYNLWEAKE